MKKKKNKKQGFKYYDRFFCIAAFAMVFMMGGAYLVNGQKEMSGVEELARFPQFSFAAYLDGGFQDKLEQAAKDQFVLHDQAIAWNADINAVIQSTAKKSFSLLRGYGFQEDLVPFGEVYRMYGSDWLMNLPYSYDEETEDAYRRKADEINQLAKNHPETKVYVYYCTRAEDLNWFDETEGLESYPWYNLLDGLLQDTVSFERMKFRDFSEYQNRMYRTDHHWNHVGADVGYADILRLMSADYELGMARSVLRAEDYDGLLWMGSRGRECGKKVEAEALDLFSVNQYILPEHTTLFGGKEQEIGLQKAYESGAVNREIGFDQYLNYFGFESDVITLRYEEGEHNLLIVGDSFARAVREPLSSHFGTTVFINFRILEQVDLEGVLQENEIDTILFMGQQDAWSGYFLNAGEETK